MSKKDGHVKILNEKIKIKKDKVDVWTQMGIDETKRNKLEAQQERLEAWLEEIEAMGDY
ncbi:MAG: hypothetical protein WC333_01895 [Dehalococcoidia bacterium]|jgi:hypothetical protein